MEAKSLAAMTSEAEALELLIGDLADEFTAELERGQSPDVERYAQRYPEHASRERLRRAADFLRGLLCRQTE